MDSNEHFPMVASQFIKENKESTVQLQECLLALENQIFVQTLRDCLLPPSIRPMQCERQAITRKLQPVVSWRKEQ